MSSITVRIEEDIIMMAVEKAMTNSISRPLIISGFIIDNINTISIVTLSKIRNHVEHRLINDMFGEIDMVTWEKLLNSLNNLLGGYQI